MISREALLEQVDKIGFNPNGWGRSEVNELANILMPDEEIEEMVNGYYEAGFALLVATKYRVLLVDKKPLNYLTVEDLRFDMISEFDYSHRVVGAHVSINSGNKTLEFTSLNQKRLRELLNYVQIRMTQMKKDLEGQQHEQKQHLEEMNAQLKEYLENAHLQMQAQQQDHQLQMQKGQYVLPAPVAPAPKPLHDLSGFEQAAASSMGLSSTGQEANKRAISPQQLSIAAARRVFPLAKAYGRRQQIEPASEVYV